MTDSATHSSTSPDDARNVHRDRDFRFGVNLLGMGDGPGFLSKVRAVAEAGVDVVMVPDHLGLIGPAPALVAAASAAPDLRVGTFVLNTAFYRPALLTRDLATVDQLTGGRLEIGLGAGYVESEFEQAGLPFDRPGARITHMMETVAHIRSAAGDHVPAFVQSPPPIMIAGVGDRVLSAAARHADIVALSNLPDLDVARERVDHIRAAAGDRFGDLELNVIIFDIAVGREVDVTPLRSHNDGVDDETLRRSVNLLHGSVDEVADRIRTIRDQTGISYFTFVEPSADDLTSIADVISRLR
ncbi:TIGR03621 family F420-dependent LLM class oxidoreductase [Streptomyces sp. SID6673]|nr:TIGR03621 family F420-dependent LLM class oxidoreductase [Streptomyces sp. SID11726]NEB27454.1 TIGR03621 family F420-dependent LLM class oxidoreductase [Streptomyces sp. SID6673]